MKQFICLLTALLLCTQLFAQEKKLIRGFDGGMMIHSGFLRGTIDPIGLEASGAPFGVGGVARLHLGNHFRVGGEGYISTLNQKGNGSYVKYGWGGLEGDIYFTAGRWMPFLGMTVGGGRATTLLMSETPAEAWRAIDDTIYNSEGFMAFDPFVGCDFIVSQAMHLTLKVDYMHSLMRGHQTLPIGPRVYFGFLFYH